MRITVIDGQGGSLGKALVAAIKKRFPEEEVFAIGTNALATGALLSGGADAAATGENPVLVACRTSEVIIGPIGLLAADSLHGEITPAMAVAVGQSPAHKILLPITKCNVSIVGKQELSAKEMIEGAVAELAAYLVDRSR